VALPTGLRTRGDTYDVQFRAGRYWRLKCVGTDLELAPKEHERLRLGIKPRKPPGGRLQAAWDASEAPKLEHLVERWQRSHETRCKPSSILHGRQRARGLLRYFNGWPADHVRRFPTPGQLSAYFGLVPRVSQSAGRCHHGSITKAGSSTARSLAIEAAQVVARSSSPLSATYWRVRRKRGHNVAVTALARKLIVVVWHLLQHGEPYRYAPPTRTRIKLRRLDLERRRVSAVPQSLEDVYREARLPALASPRPAERRAAARNRAVITRLSRQARERT